jgi:aryl-alcohol dehydrogenase-like predicted oxidoreductase
MAYGGGRSEEMLSAAINGRRDQLILATKTNWRQQTRSGIEANLNASLRRLGTDYIDLYQVHGDHPDLYTLDDLQQIVHGEVLEAMERARDAGKVRFIGITSEDPTAVMPFLETGRFDTVQVRYNLVYQEAFHHLLPQCERLNVGVLTMRTNTSGILQKYLAATGWQENGGAYNPSEAALNYVLSDTRVSCAIVGMRSVRSVESTVSVAENTATRVDLEWLHARRADAERSQWTQPAA